MRPVSASARTGRTGRLRRRLRWASSASSSGVPAPAISALSIARADTPSTVVTHAPELDVRRLADLQDAVRFPGALVDQALAVADDVAQLALRRRRHEAPAEQAEFEELGEPLAVGHVRLATRPHLHMLRVHHRQLAAPLEKIVDGTPVDARRLHCDVGAVDGG